LPESFDLKGALHRRRGIIIFLSIPLCGGCLAGGIFYLQPEYEIQSTLVLRSSAPYIMDPNADLNRISQNYEAFRQTQFLRIKGRAVLFEALQILREMATAKESMQADFDKIKAKQHNDPDYKLTEDEKALTDKLNYIRGVTLKTKKVLERHYLKSTGQIDDAIVENDLLSALQADKSFTVKPIKGTYAFSIGITVEADTKSDADQALLDALPKLINAIVYTYNSQYRSSIYETTRNTINVLKAEGAKLERELTSKRNELTELARKIDIMTGGMTQNRYELMALEIQKQIAATDNMLIQAELGLNAAQSQLDQAKKRPSELMINEMVESDPIIMRLMEDLRERKRMKLILAEQVSATDPKIVNINNQVKVLDKQLEKDRKEVREKVSKRILDSREEALLQANKRVELLQIGRKKANLAKEQNLKEAKELYRRGEISRIKINDYEDSIREIKQNLSQIRKRNNAIEIEQKAKPKLELITLASTPDRPSRDRRHRYIIAGCIVSLMIAFGFGLLLDARDKRVITCLDIKNHVRAPILGVIQHIRRRKRKTPGKICVEKTSSSAAEQYRRIVSLIINPTDGKEIRSILITSPGKGDGKTTLSSNLACAMAQFGKKVLLIDANMHNPGLSAIFNMSDEPGLTELMTGECVKFEAIHRSQVPNLDILPGGNSRNSFAANPLSVGDGNRFLSEVRNDYDFVILDTPPILLTSDSSAIAAAIDGIICSVRSAQRNRGEVSRTVESIRKTGSNFLGIVLNGVKPIRGGYYKELHRDYHHYSAQGEKNAKKNSVASL